MVCVQETCASSDLKDDIGTGVDILRNAPWMYEFVLCDGRKLRNVFELIDALDNMNDGVFKAHVNESKNDFSNWLRDVFGDDDLAEGITCTKDRIETQRLIMKHTIRKLLELCCK